MMKILKKFSLFVIVVSIMSCSSYKTNKVKNNTNKKEQSVNNTKQTTKNEIKAVVENDENYKTKLLKGRSLFLKNACSACHHNNELTVGPSIKEIAKTYTGQRKNLIKFLRGKANAIIYPAQYAIMEPNLNLTKKMNDADLEALVDYLLSVK